MRMANVIFQREPIISHQEFIGILDQSGLGKRRPIDNPQLLKRMLEGSNLIVTARLDGELIGFLRGLTDFCFRCFIADLAVVKSWQRKNIGKHMLQFTRDLVPEARLILFSAEDAEGFYQKAGFHLHERCYQLKPGDLLF